MSRTLTIILSSGLLIMNYKDKKLKTTINSLNADQEITKILPHSHFQPSVIERSWLSAFNWSPDYNFKQTWNKYKHIYLPFLYVLPRNCPADRNNSCRINYALNAWYAIARAAGNKPQTQPRETFLHQHRARKLQHEKNIFISSLTAAPHHFSYVWCQKFCQVSSV